MPIDTLADARLPDIDGLWIGGGFPERHAAQLEQNRSLRESIRNALDNGLPAYAECGGLMYLSRRLHWNGQSHEMVGAIDAETQMHDRPQGRGYVQLEAASESWPPGSPPGEALRAHEFHYSSLEGLAAGHRYAWRMLRGQGIDGRHDGLIQRNLLASYCHLRDTPSHPWVRRFLQFVRECGYRTPTVDAAAGASA